MTISFGHDHSTHNQDLGVHDNSVVHTAPVFATYTWMTMPTVSVSLWSQAALWEPVTKHKIWQHLQSIQRTPWCTNCDVTVTILHWNALGLHKQIFCVFSLRVTNLAPQFLYLQVLQSTLMTTESIQKLANRYFCFASLPFANVRQWDHMVQILLTMINGFDLQLLQRLCVS